MTGITYPNLPTDTLYKFLSVFGLIILVISFILPSLTIEDNYVEKYKLSLAFKTMERNRDDIGINISSIDTLLNSKNFKETNTILRYQNAKGIFFIDSSGYKGFISVVERRRALIEMVNRKSDSLMITKKQLENLYETETKLITYCNNGILFGLVICVFGFVLWFVNNQVYQDLLLKIQSGYKITPEKKKKTAVETKSEEDIYIDAWKLEIQKSIFRFVLILLILLVGFQLLYDWKFPNGFFQSQKIEIVYIEK